MTANSDTATAIEFLETLLKAKIRLQDAQAEAEPVRDTVGLLFEPDALDEDQKNILRNGLKSLRKLLEAHAAYGEAVKQAEPARAIVNELFGSYRPAPADNGKRDQAESTTSTTEGPIEDKGNSKTDSKADSKSDGKSDSKGNGEVKAASKQASDASKTAK